MLGTLRLVAVLLSLLALAVAAFAQGRTTRRPDAQVTPDMKAVATGNTAFACALYGQLAAEGKNLFYSPYSLSSALAMTYGGARGQTAAQMAKALQFSLASDRLHPAWGALTKLLNESGKSGDTEWYRLVIANAIWMQQGHAFEEQFKALVARDYGAGLNLLDFMKATEAARTTINTWVEQQTNQKIMNLIPQGTLDPATRMVLTNAVYFKSNWDVQFQKNATKDEPFLLGGTGKVTVPMMHQQAHMGYLDAAGVQAVEMPYLGHQLGMLVIVPKEAGGLAAVEKGLTPAKLDEWAGGVKTRLVDLALPRFKTTSEFKVRRALTALGMTDAFTPGKADFTAMGEGELYISEVLHKAYVDVNEEGTEAAAATAVVMRMGAAMQPETPVTVRADRPFLFVIRHRNTGAVLFVGKVANPKE